MPPLPMFAIPSRLKRWVPLVFATVMGILAVVLINRYLTSQRRILEAERARLLADYQEPIAVVAAAKDLPEGHTIQPQDVGMATVPERFAQPYASRVPGDVVGLVTVVPMAQGEQILTNKLRRPEQAPMGSVLSMFVPKGRRGVTISVDPLTGVGGFVRPGDVVDVLWTIRVPQPGQPEGQVVLTLFQDVPVVAVGQQIRATSDQAAATAGPFNITLALTPQETSFLIFARDQGQIQLSLRPRLETGSQVAVEPANTSTLTRYIFGETAIPQAAAPTPPRLIEVFKGLERTVVSINANE